MNSTERVVAALDFKKPDRIPRYEIFRSEFVSKWRKEKKLPENANIYDYYKKVDIGSVFRPCGFEGPFVSKKGLIKEEGETYYERDDWGRILKKKKDCAWFEEVEVAIKDKKILDTLTFESPQLEQRYAEVDLTLPYMKKRFAPVCGVLGLYMSCYYLRGQVPFFMDLAEDVPFCRRMVEKVVEYVGDMATTSLERLQTKPVALWIHDEFSDKNGPLISPAVVEELFLPAYKKMIAYIKSQGVKHVILHCDGNSLPLFDLLIEAGFTGVQSMAPSAGMWLPDVKKQWGNKLALIGGMCNITTLVKGTRNEIEKQARAILEVAGDGGVIIGTHSVDGDVPVESYDFYYSVLEEYDKDYEKTI